MHERSREKSVDKSKNACYNDNAKKGRFSANTSLKIKKPRYNFMQKFFSAKRLCRAGVIAALYVALTYAFGSLSHNGFLQIRPAEALCILPIFFVEAIPALFIGCAISNLTSPYLFYDVIIGSLVTLVAACATRYVGGRFKNAYAKLFIGGAFPVLLNAFLIPVIIVFFIGETATNAVIPAYFSLVLSMLVTQSVWVYGLGSPLYFFLRKTKKLFD